VAAIPVLFTVNAATVGLAIEAPLSRNPDPLVPPLAEIAVEKIDAFGFGGEPAALRDQRMVLKTAVEEGRGESGEPFLTGNLRRPGETQFIAVAAAALFPERNLPQKRLQGVILRPKDP
jgi:hypothetical protein